MGNMVLCGNCYAIDPLAWWFIVVVLLQVCWAAAWMAATSRYQVVLQRVPGEAWRDWGMIDDGTFVNSIDLR